MIENKYILVLGASLTPNGWEKTKKNYVKHYSRESFWTKSLVLDSNYTELSWLCAEEKKLSNLIRLRKKRGKLLVEPLFRKLRGFLSSSILRNQFGRVIISTTASNLTSFQPHS